VPTRLGDTLLGTRGDVRKPTKKRASKSGEQAIRYRRANPRGKKKSQSNLGGLTKRGSRAGACEYCVLERRSNDARAQEPRFKDCVSQKEALSFRGKSRQEMIWKGSEEPPCFGETAVRIAKCRERDETVCRTNRTGAKTAPVAAGGTYIKRRRRFGNFEKDCVRRTVRPEGQKIKS